jgi:ABC-type phosphate transport system, ATPase component
MGFVKFQGVNAWYGKKQALTDISFEVPRSSIYAFIGPSGCGKTTLLRSVNRLNDFIKSFKLDGSIEIDGVNTYGGGKRFAEKLRREIGMVFQQTNPLPMTILQNLELPVKEHYRQNPRELIELSEQKLRQAALFDEVKDRLNKNASSLSGGQQQRLCIARALMLEPKLLLMDEPCSALDPIATYKIEELLLNLKERHTIIIVTHNMEQAARIADYTAFFYEGQLVEYGKTQELFFTPKKDLTQRYITGRF